MAINLGLQDAMNLGWKLAATVRGQAPEGLLDSYHAERHPVGARVLSLVAAQGLLLFGGAETDGLREVLAEVLALPVAERHLAGLLSGVSIRYPSDAADPLGGSRIPHVALRSTSTMELLHGGQVVLLDLAPGRYRGRTVSRGWSAAGPAATTLRRRSAARQPTHRADRRPGPAGRPHRVDERRRTADAAGEPAGLDAALRRCLGASAPAA